MKALTSFWTTFGFPKVVQTDQWSNFMSRTSSQLGIQPKDKHQVSSAYHPESQGALEHFLMLCSYCTELSQDWEEGLPWLMLGIREVLQESTGFSSNELVFGCAVGDKMKNAEPPDDVLNYVNGFRHRLHIACATAHRNLSGSGKAKPICLSQGIKFWVRCL